MAKTIYLDLENNFPESVDVFEKFQDPSISQLAVIQQYKKLYSEGKITEAVALLEENHDLKHCIINAENLNKLRDAIISMQRYYLKDVQSYLMNVVKWRGAWSDRESYNKYDVVSYTRKNVVETFMAVVNDIPMGTTPINLEYWVPITLRGERGIPGTQLAGRGNWSPNEDYYVDNWVAHNSTIWAASNDNFNSEPYDGSPDWYPVIRDQQHYVISKDEPTAQYTNDIWYKILENGTIQSKYKQPNGSYLDMNFAGSSILMADGSTLYNYLKAYTKTQVLSYTIPASKWILVSGYDDLFRQTITDSMITSLVKAGRTRIDLNMDYAYRLALEDFGVEELWVENQNGAVVVFERGIKLTDNVDVQLTLIDTKQ